MAGRPPRLARVLVDQLASPEVAGDLAEEFRAGRSAAWYWRQAGGAIAAAIGRDIRTSPLVPLRAIVTGWIALTILANAHQRLVDVIDRLLLPEVTAWHASWMITSQIWVVYRVVLWFVVTAVTGWVVGRVHRRHRAAAVLAMAAAYVVQTAYYLALAALDANLWALQPPLYLVLATEVACVSGLLMGGLGLTPPPEPLLKVRDY
jgi:hypothetical protein